MHVAWSQLTVTVDGHIAADAITSHYCTVLIGSHDTLMQLLYSRRLAVYRYIPYYLAVTPPPPPPPPLWYYSSCTCTRVEAHRKNRSRPFSLISDGFLRPLILHVILLCNPQLVGGVWLRDYLLYFAENSIIYMYRTAPLLCPPPPLCDLFSGKEGGGVTTRTCAFASQLSPPPPPPPPLP